MKEIAELKSGLQEDFTEVQQRLQRLQTEAARIQGELQEATKQAEAIKARYQQVEALEAASKSAPKKKRGRPRKAEAQANGTTESATAE